MEKQHKLAIFMLLFHFWGTCLEAICVCIMTSLFCYKNDISWFDIDAHVLEIEALGCSCLQLFDTGMRNVSEQKTER